MKLNINPLLFTLPVVVAGSCNRSNEKESNKKPNIIIIYADDLGYGSLGCYGTKSVATPNIDKLASNGLRFTNAYATASVSTPSRYSLLTGEYFWNKPSQWNIGNLKGTSIAPGDAGLLIDTSMTTLPDVLKAAGYTCGAVGKWHLGLGPSGAQNWNQKISPGPAEIGFDYSFLIPATGDRVPCVYLENQKVVGLDPSDPIRISYNEPIGHDSTIYNTNLKANEVVAYSVNDTSVKRNRKPVKMHPSHGHDKTIINGIPRIGYMTGGTAALWKDEEMAGRITGKALDFIEQNKNKRFFIYFATQDIHVPRAPGEKFAGKSSIGVYGDVIMELDWSVGEIMKKLDDLNLTENTLVIFSSDNGPVIDDGYYDGSFENIREHNATGSLRGGKYSAFEGGTRIPLIVHWPGKVKQGTTSALFSQVDIAHSLAALIGFDSNEKISKDSYNHLSALLGEDPKGREYVLQQNVGGTLSVIKGNWKYIQHGKGQKINNYVRPPIELGNDSIPQLYDLSKDRGEVNNVAAKYPEIVRELSDLLKVNKFPHLISKDRLLNH